MSAEDIEPGEEATARVERIKSFTERKYTCSAHRIEEYEYWIEFLKCYIPYFQPSINQLHALIEAEQKRG
jgi:hypothetical protein